MKNKNYAQRLQYFVDAHKKDPAEIIAWAKREIQEYQKIIAILEREKVNEVIKKPSTRKRNSKRPKTANI